jgi:transposase
LIEPLMLAHSNLISQVIKYDDQLKTMARSNQTVRRLMTVPGVGPVTALAFASTVDDPQRFERASDVGAYLGLTPRRYQSGELDRTGRISKRGDRLTRCYLFEAANVLLRVVRRGSPLKSWGLKLWTMGSPDAAVPLLMGVFVLVLAVLKSRSSDATLCRRPGTAARNSVSGRS